MITITLYWGLEDWDGPETLKEMLETDDESILKYVGDYSINLISLNKISEDELKNFKTSLKYVIEAIQCASSEEKWDNLLRTEEAFKNLDKESADTINTLTGLGLDIKTSEEGSEIDMCKAWDDHKQSGIREGIELGRTEGITILINYSKEFGVSYDNTKIALINKYNISSDEAEKYMSENWK